MIIILKQERGLGDRKVLICSAFMCLEVWLLLVLILESGNNDIRVTGYHGRREERDSSE